jgi:hypothetical protein
MMTQLQQYVFACVGALTVVVAGAAPPAQYSASELQAKLGALNAQIHGYHIVYDAFTASVDGASGIAVHREVAAFSPSLFSHWSAKQTRLYIPEQDPLQQRLIINGDTAITEYAADRAFKRSQMRGQLPGSAPREIMFLALGWWPFKEWRTPQLVPGTAVVLPDVATSLEYRARSEQDRVGDRWCHVLEHPNHDRLWLDTDRGCMIVVREILDPASGVVAQRIEALDPIEVATGIWAPKKLRNLLFDTEQRHLRVDSQLLIRKIEVNAAPPTNVLDVTSKPGSIRLDGDSFVQCQAGGLDFLDETAARLKQFSRYDSVTPTPRSTGIKMLATMLLFVAFGGIMTVRAMTHPTSLLAKFRPHRN